MVLKSSSRRRISACVTAQDAATKICGKKPVPHPHGCSSPAAFTCISPHSLISALLHVPTSPHTSLPPCSSELGVFFNLHFNVFSPQSQCTKSHTPPCKFKWQAFVQSYCDSSTLTFKTPVTAAPLCCQGPPASVAFNNSVPFK